MGKNSGHLRGNIGRPSAGLERGAGLVRRWIHHPGRKASLRLRAYLWNFRRRRGLRRLDEPSVEDGVEDFGGRASKAPVVERGVGDAAKARRDISVGWCPNTGVGRP